MSRSELHNWECAIEKLSGDNADKMLAIAQDIYNTAFVRGKNYMSWEKTKWIPCSERLPEESDLVIICSEFGGIEFGSYEEGKWYWLAESCSCYLEESNDEVVAWMPMPSPYREDGTEGR